MQMQGYDLALNTNYEYCGSDLHKAVENSSALIIGTEWDDYVHANYRDIRNRMNKNRAILYDLRAILDPVHIKQIGFDKIFKLGNPLTE